MISAYPVDGGDSVAHGGAVQQLHTGSNTVFRPSMGSWITYGLGTENQNLPGFITIRPGLFDGGSKNYGSGFLPAAFQGTPIGECGVKVEDLLDQPIEFLKNQRVATEQQRNELEMLQTMNRQHAMSRTYNADLEARIQAFELAFRMQIEAPEVLRSTKSPKHQEALWDRSSGNARFRVAMSVGSKAGQRKGYVSFNVPTA